MLSTAGVFEEKASPAESSSSRSTMVPLSEEEADFDRVVIVNAERESGEVPLRIMIE